MGQQQLCCPSNSYESMKINETNSQRKVILPTVQKKVKLTLEEYKPFEKQFSELSFRSTTKTKSGIYQGDTDNQNKFNGLGTLYKLDGSVLQAHFQQGVANGPAFYVMKDGSFYQGELVSNKATTKKGIYKSDGLSYQGQFKNNMFDGEGVLKGPNYDFKGIFSKGKKVQGKFKWQDNKQMNEYTGNFDEEQLFTGQGELIESNGKYEGNFKHGCKEGKGKYLYKQGLVYDGYYKNGLRCGQGTMYNKDEKVSYVGNWQNGLPSGKGVAYQANGDKVQTNWVEGISQSVMASK